ncbi:sulfotransferase [Candidatus Pelagibacter sp.]|nr:sulfotransferase [Candidatus Pelagibacter sp.]
MDFIITFDPRSGSTFVSKLLTTKFNSAVLPESNFIFFIQKYSNDKKKLINKLLEEKKFKSYKINKKKLRLIINKEYPNIKKIINMISKTATKNIYKKENIIIGVKKHQIESTQDLLNLFQKLKLIHILRDPRNIYISKRAVAKINGKFSTSILVNSYIWVKILNEIEQIKKKYTKRIKLFKYENITKDNLNFEKNVKKFLKLKQNYSKRYFLPHDQKNIHVNLNKKKFNQNVNSFQNKLNFFEKIIFKLLCYKYLLKYGYEKKTALFYQITSTLFLYIVKIYSSKLF